VTGQNCICVTDDLHWLFSRKQTLSFLRVGRSRSHCGRHLKV